MLEIYGFGEILDELILSLMGFFDIEEEIYVLYV